MQISIGIIEAWPAHMLTGRKYSAFKANYSDTVTLLEGELEKLRAHSAVVQLALRPGDLRIDGQMRANATPHHPGVILSFTGKHGHVTMPCGTYTHWHHNLRAIALSLQALRTVDRYGVTSNGEQYRGWKQLPSGIEMPAATMTVEDAARVVAVGAGVTTSSVMDPAAFQSCYRDAAKKIHPDVGGERFAWDRLQPLLRF